MNSFWICLTFFNCIIHFALLSDVNVKVIMFEGYQFRGVFNTTIEPGVQACIKATQFADGLGFCYSQDKSCHVFSTLQGYRQGGDLDCYFRDDNYPSYDVSDEYVQKKLKEMKDPEPIENIFYISIGNYHLHGGTTQITKDLQSCTDAAGRVVATGYCFTPDKKKCSVITELEKYTSGKEADCFIVNTKYTGDSAPEGYVKQLLDKYTQSKGSKSNVIKKDPCPNSWAYYEITKKCYKLTGTIGNFEKIASICAKENGVLASVHSKKENDFITDLIKRNGTDKQNKDTWIGLKKTNQNSTNFWLDGSVVDYTNWDIGMPVDNHDTYATAVFFSPDLGDKGKVGHWNSKNVPDLIRLNGVCQLH